MSDLSSWIAVLILPPALVLGACVPVPVRGTLEQVEIVAGRVEPLRSGEGVVILGVDASADEDSMPACVRETMEAANAALRTVPVREFRRALFPWFDLETTEAELATILAKPRVQKAIADLGLRYAIIVGRVHSAVGPEQSLIVAGWSKHTSRLHADIWDLREAVVKGAAESTASGTEGAVGLPLPLGAAGVGVMMALDTQTPACQGLARRLADLLAGRKLPPEPRK